jgi:hypothetical protein
MTKTPLNRGSPKVVDARYDSSRKNFKLLKLENMAASEIFSDLHLVLMKYKDKDHQ